MNKRKYFLFHRRVKCPYKLTPNKLKKTRFPFGTIRKLTKIRKSDEIANKHKMKFYIVIYFLIKLITLRIIIGMNGDSEKIVTEIL